jgi:orotate phosphoribosyltransferase
MVVGIVDRHEGGTAAFAARNLPFRSLLSVRDLGVDIPAGSQG